MNSRKRNRAHRVCLMLLGVKSLNITLHFDLDTRCAGIVSAPTCCSADATFNPPSEDVRSGTRVAAVHTCTVRVGGSEVFLHLKYKRTGCSALPGFNSFIHILVDIVMKREINFLLISLSLMSKPEMI